VLCGVDIDYAQGLAGHSDADVAVHALMDALLGATGLGDIGEMFPDTDPAFQDASSMQLLGKVMAWLTQNGWSVVNADVTVICERPRLAGYRLEMRENLAAALCVASDAVSVKATTTEGMGFEGRGEGIAASAVCLLTRQGQAPAER
jgi:2-C-methyl-D-erythritol 2,4-cyclodiphosphate synthase